MVIRADKLRPLFYVFLVKEFFGVALLSLFMCLNDTKLKRNITSMGHEALSSTEISLPKKNLQFP